MSPERLDRVARELAGRGVGDATSHDRWGDPSRATVHTTPGPAGRRAERSLTQDEVNLDQERFRGGPARRLDVRFA